MDGKWAPLWIFFFLSVSFAAPLHYQTLVLTSLPTSQPQTLSSATEQTSESEHDSTLPSLAVHHVDDLFSAPNSTPESLFRHRLTRDAIRVKTLSAIAVAARTNATRKSRSAHGRHFSSSIISGLSQGSGEYFARIGVGTPARSVYMVLDTGSDIVWLQCSPCRRCYKQTGPLFDPKKSSTFASVTCESDLCHRLDNGACDNGTKCTYRVDYGDGSFTSGDFSTETLTFSGTKIPTVAFGCGNDNEGLFVGAAGVLGLGGGNLSLPSEAGRHFGKKFSYCLVNRFTVNKTETSSLLFGDSAVSRKSIFTPLLVNPNVDTYYYVGLSGISVGEKRVPGITASLFKLDSVGHGGMIVDSGTSVTRLVQPGYNALRDAFRAAAANLGKSSEFSLFDTCFDLSGQTTVQVPTVVLHFKGGDMTLPAENYLIPVDSRGTYCLAFAGTKYNLSILGNIQQQGFRVSFDKAVQRLGWAPNAC